MRFGTYVLPISGQPEGDFQVIENTLREAELAEEIGMDTVWLLEHHFGGEVVYADPVVFAAAVAMRTRRVRIGFAVVQLALHHPVRLAAQTALLDNLSHGRLIVGVGRGSAFNEYEYIGFGTSIEDGRMMLPEAEELLVKAWTSEDVRHEGRFWNVSFPILRPRPYQQPHPPLVRSCLSEESLVEMAKLGRPVLLSVHTVADTGHRLQLYRDTMLDAGFDEAAVEKALDQTWTMRFLYVAESDEQAIETAKAAHQRCCEHLRETQRKYNPHGIPPPQTGQPPNPFQDYDIAVLAGSPGKVAAQIAELRDVGVRNLMLNVNTGQMPHQQVERSMRLFGEKVLPQFPSN